MAKHIKRRRLELGLFQRQVADIIGVRENTIYNWEHGIEPELIHMRLLSASSDTPPYLFRRSMIR
jgi:DNA-binding XRE family transcriptional regulator